MASPSLSPWASATPFRHSRIRSALQAPGPSCSSASAARCKLAENAGPILRIRASPLASRVARDGSSRTDTCSATWRIVRERAFTASISGARSRPPASTPIRSSSRRTAGSSSAAGSAERYWPFIHSSLVVSNTAAFFWMPSSVEERDHLAPRAGSRGRRPATTPAARGSSAWPREGCPDPGSRPPPWRHAASTASCRRSPGSSGRARRSVARTERAIQGDLLRGVGDVVVAPDHVRDPHGDVVAHHGEIVDGRPVTPQDHEVVEVTALKADAPVDRVVPRDLPVLQQKADGERRAGREPALDLVG